MQQTSAYFIDMRINGVTRENEVVGVFFLAFILFSLLRENILTIAAHCYTFLVTAMWQRSFQMQPQS